MSERLRGLIEQGRQALEKEVVIMVDDDTLAGDSEEQGVEDDGSRDWEDDDDAATGLSSSSSRPSRLARGIGRFPSSISLSSHISSAATFQPLSSSVPSRGLSRRPSSHVLRPSPSLSHSPSSYSQSIPIPYTSSSSIADRDRFWQYSTAHAHSMPAGLDDELVSGSPELRESMERARGARLGMAPKP